MFVLVLTLWSSGLNAQTGNREFGYFVGTVVARWITPDREMELVEDFTYIDPSGFKWTAPRGSIIDGASILRILWTAVGSPFTGAYRSAAVVHDVACETRRRTSEEAHLMFYNAMRAAGVGPRQGKLMFAAVYHFGPWWDIVRLELPREITQQQLERLTQFIDTDPTLDEIQRFPISNRAQ